MKAHGLCYRDHGVVELDTWDSFLGESFVDLCVLRMLEDVTTLPGFLLLVTGFLKLVIPGPVLLDGVSFLGAFDATTVQLLEVELLGSDM